MKTNIHGHIRECPPVAQNFFVHFHLLKLHCQRFSKAEDQCYTKVK